MQAHWKAVAGFSLAMLTALIIAIAGGSYYWVYGLVAGGAVFAFAYLISVARFDDRPSHADEDHQRRARGRHLPFES